MHIATCLSLKPSIHPYSVLKAYSGMGVGRWVGAYACARACAGGGGDAEMYGTKKDKSFHQAYLFEMLNPSLFKMLNLIEYDILA